jgi:dihydroxyacetone kinase-like predicted kinase
VRVTRLVSGETPETHVAVPGAHAETGTGIVACTAGDGLAQLFRDAGAAVVPSGPGHRASTGQLIDAIRDVHARGVDGVVILPNDGDTELAAAAAARAVADEGIVARVVRARTVVQGIAALAVFEPGASLSANVLGMQSAASATRHGAVTIANREALTSGGSCHPGDVLGVVDGDIVIVGSDQARVGAEVVRRLLSSGGELLTVVSGADAPPGLVQAVSAAARAERRDIEVSRIHGGQLVYTVLLGVE